MGRHRILAPVLVVMALAGCSGGTSPPTAEGPPATKATTISIAVASSLSEAATFLGQAFHLLHPEVKVTVSSAGSAALAEQLHQGAPYDVVAVADEQTARRIEAADDAGPFTVIARNRLVIVVAKANPKHVTGLADLERRDVLVSLCAPEVPCGRLAVQALGGRKVRPASLEDNVKAVVTRVVSGQADAGIAYATDVRAEPKVAGISTGIPDEPALEAVYSIAVTAGSRDATTSRRFVDYVASPEGRRLLVQLGFLPS